MLPVNATPYSSLAGAHPFIDTESNVHLFASFDYRMTNLAAVSRFYDFIWGAAVNNVTILRTGNPDIMLSYYILFHRDNGTFLDSGAYQQLSYWQTVRPDWILYKCDRVTPAYEYNDKNIPFDFANPALISWQLQTYAQPASVHGYDSIAADNVDLSNRYGACGSYRDGQWVQRYSGEADDLQWRIDILSWLRHMQQALHQLPHPLALIANLALGEMPPGASFVQQVITSVDGILYEDGFTLGGTGYLTGENWLQLIQFARSVQKQQKPFYFVNQYRSETINSSQIQWALASYLMAKDHLAGIYISPYQDYGTAIHYQEYGVQIGSPTSDIFQSQHVYWREYTHGLSIVNPSATETYLVTLHSQNSYTDLSGHAVTQLMLTPHTGSVLVQKSARTVHRAGNQCSSLTGEKRLIG